MPSALALMLEKPTLMSFAQNGTRPQRIMSKLRSPAFASKRMIGTGSVGATFQLGAMFGVGRCGGIEKTSLISLTSEERRTRPHMVGFPKLSTTLSALDTTGTGMTFCLRTNEEQKMPGNPRDMITVAERRFPVRIRIAVP